MACRFSLAALLLVLVLPSSSQSFGPAHPEWATPIAPFRIADNLYYVGSKDLASYLIVTPAGDILINSSLKTSPPLILDSIQQLGFHSSYAGKSHLRQHSFLAEAPVRRRRPPAPLPSQSCSCLR